MLRQVRARGLPSSRTPPATTQQSPNTSGNDASLPVKGNGPPGVVVGAVLGGTVLPCGPTVVVVAGNVVVDWITVTGGTKLIEVVVTATDVEVAGTDTVVSETTVVAGASVVDGATVVDGASVVVA